MMKRKLKHFAIIALVFAGVFAACTYLDSVSVDQPQDDGTMAPRIKVGETATFVMKGRFETNEDHAEGRNLVIGMLAPRDWNIAKNCELTFRGTEVVDWDDIYTMSLIPSTSSPNNMPGYTWPEAAMERFGLGPNRYNDMEWVVWQADELIPVFNGTHATYEVTIKCKVGQQNLSACLGFFVNNLGDGMTTDDKYVKYAFSDPFEVYGGVGETIDFGKLRFNSVEPSRAIQDDIVTFTFAGDSYSNDLIDQPEIYLYAKARTAEGNTYESARVKMERANTFTHNYSCTIWPAGQFPIQEDETITYIDYYFADANGEHPVNKSLDMQMGGDTPASDDIPFTFQLVCGAE